MSHMNYDMIKHSGKPKSIKHTHLLVNNAVQQHFLLPCLPGLDPLAHCSVDLLVVEGGEAVRSQWGALFDWW